MIIKGLNCLGLMGTSTYGGVELALIRTDGLDVLERKKAYVVPYPDEIKEKIRSVWGLKRDVADNEEKLHAVDIAVSDFYIKLINDFREECSEPIDVVGIEGITIAL